MTKGKAMGHGKNKHTQVPPSVTLSLVPQYLPDAGGSSTITWTTQNATSAVVETRAVGAAVDGAYTQVASGLSGSKVLTVTESTVVRVTAHGQGGDASQGDVIACGAIPG